MLKFFMGFIIGAICLSVGLIAKPFFLPPAPSVYAGDKAIAAAASIREQLAPHMFDLMRGDITKRRAILDQYFFAPKIATARKHYPVTESILEIDGVYTEIFEPAAGIQPSHHDRVLINLHGGGFSMGARTEGRLESIPVAHVSGLRVLVLIIDKGLSIDFLRQVMM
mgnify:CR=1 FL=1